MLGSTMRVKMNSARSNWGTRELQMSRQGFDTYHNQSRDEDKNHTTTGNDLLPHCHCILAGKEPPCPSECDCYSHQQRHGRKWNTQVIVAQLALSSRIMLQSVELKDSNSKVCECRACSNASEEDALVSKMVSGGFGRNVMDVRWAT